MEQNEDFARRILFVDDETELLAEFEKILRPPENTNTELKELDAKLFGASEQAKQKTYDITLCTQGDQAVSEVKQALQEDNPFAAAFIDMRMPPGPNGVWTAENIRKLDPDIQIVIVTGYSDIDPEEISSRVPPEDKLLYIQKPVHAQELRQLASTLTHKWFVDMQLQSQTTELEQLNRQLKSVICDHQENEKELKKLNRKLEEHDRLKSEFIITVSHELRTPLTIFKNVISNALAGVMGKLDPKLEKHLKISEESIGRLACIISDFLDLSKMDVGQLRVETEQINVNSTISEIMEMLRFSTNEKDITLEVELAEREMIVNGDRDKIEQIMTNLVDNAAKFVPKKNGKITVRVRECEDWVTFEVQDNGPGIEGDDLNIVFDRFVQISKDTGPGKHGTGLGLSICKELIKLQGGGIWAENPPTGGALFTFTLPKCTPSSSKKARRKQLQTAKG